MHTMAYNGSQVNIAGIGEAKLGGTSFRREALPPKLPRGSFAPPLAEIGSHGFPRVSCMDNKVAGQVMAENGGKWVAAVIW